MHLRMFTLIVVEESDLYSSFQDVKVRHACVNVFVKTSLSQIYVMYNLLSKRNV